MSYSLEFIAHVILEKQSANVPKGTKKKLQESCLIHVFCLRKSARSAGDIGVSIEYSCLFIFPQMAQITQRNTASCIITQRKTGCLRVMLFCRFGVCLRLSARSAGDLLFPLCKLLEYSYVFILPQMAQITQTNTA